MRVRRERKRKEREAQRTERAHGNQDSMQSKWLSSVESEAVGEAKTRPWVREVEGGMG